MSAWLKAFQTLADETQTAPSPSELLCLLVKPPRKGRGHMQHTAIRGHQSPGKTTGSNSVVTYLFYNWKFVPFGPIHPKLGFVNILVP